MAKDKKTTEECKNIEAERDEYKELAMRLKADFDNFRKNLDRECDFQVNSSLRKIFLELLNVVDSYELAIKNFNLFMKNVNLDNDNKSELHNNFQGILFTYELLNNLLNNNNIKEIKVELKDDFDPKFHEVLIQENNNDYKDKQIIEVFQKGYLFNDNIIRFAKVKIAKNKGSDKQ